MEEYLKKQRKLSEKERRHIAREMIEGYKKMGPLNREIAQKVTFNSEEGTDSQS